VSGAGDSQASKSIFSRLARRLSSAGGLSGVERVSESFVGPGGGGPWQVCL